MSAAINTQNRLGLSLNDLFNQLISAYPHLDSHEFFQIIKSELFDECLDESQRLEYENFYFSLQKLTSQFWIDKIIKAFVKSKIEILSKNIIFYSFHEINVFEKLINFYFQNMSGE